MNVLNDVNLSVVRPVGSSSPKGWPCTAASWHVEYINSDEATRKGSLSANPNTFAIARNNRSGVDFHDGVTLLVDASKSRIESAPLILEIYDSVRGVGFVPKVPTVEKAISGIILSQFPYRVVNGAGWCCCGVAMMLMSLGWWRTIGLGPSYTRRRLRRRSGGSSSWGSWRSESRTVLRTTRINCVSHVALLPQGAFLHVDGGGIAHGEVSQRPGVFAVQPDTEVGRDGGEPEAGVDGGNEGDVEEDVEPHNDNTWWRKEGEENEDEEKTYARVEKEQIGATSASMEERE